MYQWQLCLACHRKSSLSWRKNMVLKMHGQWWALISVSISAMFWRAKGVLYAPILPTLYHQIPSSSAGVNFLPPRRRLLVMGSRGQIPSRTTIMGQVRISRTPGVLLEADSAQRSPSGKCIFVEDVLPYVPNWVFFGWHHETAFAALNRGIAEATTSECRTPGTNLSKIGHLNYRRKT